MNILFLTIGRFESIEAHSIYADLLRCFRNHGHEVFTITPYEKKLGKNTELVHENGAHTLHIKTGDVTGANNLISKGLAQISVESIYIKAIKRYFSDVKFDLVMYSTPPVTFSKVVEFVKTRDGAKSYLLLKDIFPQNAVDLGVISKNGIKGVLYRYFRKKEKKLYHVSDYIGCMSKANTNYVLDNNPEIDYSKVEICPNSIEAYDRSVDEKTREIVRKKYGIPLDKKVFVYGGNLGKPQGITFLIDCLKSIQNIEEVFFLIVGGGNEYGVLENYIKQDNPNNIKLMSRIPKDDYDSMVGACDIGLIFLDHRFTIPNFPSRLLSYMQAKMPVLACTDNSTDIGEVISEGDFGWWCESNDVKAFISLVKQILKEDISKKKENGWTYLLNHYSTENCYHIIMNHEY